jgi:DNA-binding transcriptional ArsR family regulator
MRPLLHPKKEEITLEGILYALSDTVRLNIVSDLYYAQCSKICNSFSELQGRTLPKSTICQHFKILREAGLIMSERKGVELHNSLRCKDIKDRFGSLLEQIIKSYKSQEEKPKQNSHRK